MKTSRQLLISEIFPPENGGSGRWFWEVYRRLSTQRYVVAAGIHPDQAAFDASHDLHLHRVLPRAGKWELIGAKGLAAYWKGYKALDKIVREQEIRAVHCGRVLPEGVWAMALRLRRRVPFTCYVHGEDVTWAKASREHSFLVRRVLGRASFVIANSRNTARLLEEEWSFPAAKIRVLHPGVDTRRFIPASYDAQVRSDLGWDDRPVVLTVGRLTRRKGQDHLIQALPRIRERIPNVLYSIVGGGEDRSYLEDLVDRVGVRSHVQFRGEPDDAEMIRCYQQCDLFALPNRQVDQDIEGFGMVLLEAQACGKPVLAGASGGTGETMNVPGTGRIVSCETIPPLADAIIEMLEDPQLRRRMGDQAREWTCDRFDWSSLSEQAEKLFADEFFAGDSVRSGRDPEASSPCHSSECEAALHE